MGFTVWDAASGNALGYFETEAEALALVRDLLADQGPVLGADLLLVYENGRGSGHTVAVGEELVQRAMAPPVVEALHHILRLIQQQRATQQPDLDAIEEAARAGLEQVSTRQ